jgi:hypothetical protein
VFPDLTIEARLFGGLRGETRGLWVSTALTLWSVAVHKRAIWKFQQRMPVNWKK